MVLFTIFLIGLNIYIKSIYISWPIFFLIQKIRSFIMENLENIEKIDEEIIHNPVPLGQTTTSLILGYMSFRSLFHHIVCFYMVCEKFVILLCISNFSFSS